MFSVSFAATPYMMLSLTWSCPFCLQICCGLMFKRGDCWATASAAAPAATPGAAAASAACNAWKCSKLQSRAGWNMMASHAAAACCCKSGSRRVWVKRSRKQWAAARGVLQGPAEAAGSRGRGTLLPLKSRERSPGRSLLLFLFELPGGVMANSVFSSCSMLVMPAKADSPQGGVGGWDSAARFQMAHLMSRDIWSY